MTNTQKYPDGLTHLTCDTAPDGTKFFWAKPEFRNLSLLQSQTDFAAPVLKASQTLLKEARQRFIYRTPTGTEPVVIKLFPLNFIGSKLRHPKYAYREFCNTVRARELGVSVPEPLCFIEKRRMGLVCCSGIVQQCLDGYTDLRSLYHADQLSYVQVARYATPVLIDMFERGTNHIDLRDENIMLDQKTGMLKIIDWQYANFVPPRAPWLLEYLTAYFIRLAPETYRTELAADWLPTVAEHAKLTAQEADLYVARTRALLPNRAKVKQRLALTAVAI